MDTVIGEIFKILIRMFVQLHYEEDIYLQNLNISLEDIEPMGNNCEDVLVWHTQTVRERKGSLRQWKAEEEGDNMRRLVQFLSYTGMADVSQDGYAMRSCYGGKLCD